LNKKKVVFAVLNWGFGHASRSLPIIRSLLDRNVALTLASDGAVLSFFKKTFPDLNFIQLPSYAVTYPTKNIIINSVFNFPSICRAIFLENRILKKYAKDQECHLIISDNRYGVRLKSTRSILVAHILKVPLLDLASRIASIWIRNNIKKFDECWVPDFAGEDNLSGKMSHFKSKVVIPKFIGPLSQFKPSTPKAEKDYKYCFILSGPEPARTVLEKRIIKLGPDLKMKSVLVTGRTETAPGSIGQLEIVPFLSGKSLTALIANSEIIVSRAGYSSLMDYYFLKNKFIVIPTPGHPEQEELGRLCIQKNIGNVILQKDLSIQTLRNASREIHPFPKFNEILNFERELDRVLANDQ
jgi:UDP-N-acetylglucosamine transferase subunit ALG13